MINSQELELKVNDHIVFNSLFSLRYRAFLFPTDFQLDLEFWAENGDYTRDELYDVCLCDLFPVLIDFSR